MTSLWQPSRNGQLSLLSLLRSMTASSAANRRGAVGAYGSLSLPRLSNTKRVSAAWDDPAGMAMLSQVRLARSSLTQGSRNAVHAVSMIQTADSALTTLDSILDEMLTLSQQASGGGFSSEGQAVLQGQFDSLLSDYNKVLSKVKFDGINLLTAISGATKISLGDSGDSKISIMVDDVSSVAFGLTTAGGDPTSATSTGSSTYGVADVADTYLKGPNGNPPTLTFTFDGSQGDKVAAITVRGSNSLTEIVDMINVETEALIPGWSAAEAIQVDGQYVLKVTNYEVGAANAPTVTIDGNLKWAGNTPVTTSHFTGVDGAAGGTGPLDITKIAGVTTIQDAIDVVTGMQDRLDNALRRLGIADTIFDMGIAGMDAAETRINTIVNADELAGSTTRQIISQTFLAIALQANVMSKDALQLLNVPTVSEKSESSSSDPLFDITTSLREFLSMGENGPTLSVLI